MTTAWEKPPGQVPVGIGRSGSVFLGLRPSESSSSCRQRVNAEIRQGVFLKFMALAILTGCAVVLGPLPEARAGTDTRLKIAVDYNRDCGDLEGQAAYRLKESGSQAELTVKAESYWNASGLILEKGVTYRIKVTDPDKIWKDWEQEAKATGWVKPPVSWLRLFVVVTGPLVRFPDRNIFYLMGVIYGKCEDGITCARQFPIGVAVDITAPADGEFCSFANDLPFMDSNNSASIIIHITRK